MLVVKYKYSEKQVKKIEPYMHILPNMVGIGTAFFGLFHGIYGSAMLWCWIEPDDTQFRCVRDNDNHDACVCNCGSFANLLFFESYIIGGECITFRSGLSLFSSQPL